MSMTDYVFQQTTEYIDRMPKSLRKEYGQFFTSPETARFMASLFTVPDRRIISILDPGAGSGILSVALIERLQTESGVDRIELVCYENDPNILDILKSNIVWVSDHSVKEITYQIIPDNYILSQTSDYNGMFDADPDPRKYDLVIGNPPYMKIGKDAPEALAMPDVCYGAPNMYFLFASMTKNEKQSSVNTKDKIRERYRGVDSSELTIIPAKPWRAVRMQKLIQKFW